MTSTLPLFPLGTVLLPGASLPLHIFEPRYRQLTVDLVTGAVPDRSFGVVSIKQGWEVGAENVQALQAVGCSAVLQDTHRFPDGRFDLATVGGSRFRLLEVEENAAPYLVGKVEWLPDTPSPPELESVLPLLAASAQAAHARYREAARFEREWFPEHSPEMFDDLAYRLASDCLMTMEDRQRLLEETVEARRLRLVRKVLHREAGLLAALRAVPAPLSEFGHPPNRN
ncbi:LON peptidase substrate-binding domain-containing protein [Actinosynnema pretiosum subsp. pretiosum]|uniref:Peptidase S16 lon domain protein n=2 Tax=Actinosynnema TaxID=40566 RepID=C6WDB0_ACTMD|nr:LON peptidase substrate-binding domain-containing protein [Actinosynnema mirum]ACU39547.1 peptidase S16 lon domain protein [Actinosynnema mirum DSM 43827]QUF03093.1 LON peptidase substrate-binding domain-containing protein [Actinosynnema pretiosum subsp. pretiosum]